MILCICDLDLRIQISKLCSGREHNIGIHLRVRLDPLRFFLLAQHHFFKIIKCIIKHCSCICICIVSKIIKHHRSKLKISVVCHGHKGRARLICVSSLSSGTVFIIIAVSRPKHLMVLLKDSVFLHKIGRSDGITECLNDLSEFFELIDLRCDHCHIMCSRIMFRIVESIGVHPVGIRTPNLRGTVIHLLDECIIIAAHEPAHIFCNRIGHFVC